MARQHFLKAIKNIPRAAEPGELSTKVLERQRHLAIATLLWARLDENERQHGLQARATVGRLGELAATAVIEIQSLPRQSNIRSNLWGNMAETVMAGVVLSLQDVEGKSLWLPSPASPRQDSPHGVFRAKEAVADIGQKAQAVDFNIIGYEGSAAAPAVIIPSQVKAKNPYGDTSAYHDNIMMLYGDDDLYASDPLEWQQLAQDLLTWRSQGPSRALELAQSNVGYAIERHLAL
jgi:hypothetical protein